MSDVVAGSEEVVATKISVYAIIGGKRFNQILSVSASFALNTIPTATIVFANGVTTDLGTNEPAEIHRLRAALKSRAETTIHATWENSTGEYEAIIFKGLLAGTGYKRAHDSANYTVNIIHWLADLNSSSVINADWFPGAPSDMAQNAAYRALGPNSEVTSTAVPVFMSSIVNSENLNADVWERTIKDIFTRLADTSSLLQDTEPDRRNEAALAALKLMPGKEDSGYVPLKLKVNNTDLVQLNGGIQNYFNGSAGEGFAQNTFWAKLVGDYGANFMFAVSPAVEWAYPIPFCGGLRACEADSDRTPKPGVKVITAKEYGYADLNANISQILESVIIGVPFGSPTNANQASGPSPKIELAQYMPFASWPKATRSTAGGAPALASKAGLKLFKNAPMWLNFDNGLRIEGKDFASDPGSASAPTTPPPGTTASQQTLLNTSKTITENWAKHWFYTELLQLRYGELSGVLRFDIAPGSMVKIETPLEEKEFEETGYSDNFVVASVISVSYVIDAERARTGTSFTLGHIRIPEEEVGGQRDEFTTLDVPLYEQAWYGGRLAMVTKIR